MKQKTYSYCERVELFETALEDWINTFKNKVERHTANMVAFYDRYFEYTGPASLFQEPVASKEKQKEMKSQVARIARNHKIPALSRCRVDGTPPKEYMKSWPVKA